MKGPNSYNLFPILLLGIIVFLFVWAVFKSNNTEETFDGLHMYLHPDFLIPHTHILHESVQHPVHDHLSAATVKTSVNLFANQNVIPVLDQGQYGSCTANALAYAWAIMKLRTTTLPGMPSRTFFYSLSRQHLNLPVNQDTGSTNTSSVWVLANKGEVPESSYGYTTQNIFRLPPSNILTAGVPNKKSLAAPQGKLTFSQNSTTTLTAMKTALSNGYCLLVAIAVYASFEYSNSLNTGNIPMPNTSREQFLGGHAITLAGYNDSTSRFMFRNSWGTSVGAQGVFTIPYNYITNPSLCTDVWII